MAWTGMRGIVSLCAALSLPLFTLQEKQFPARDLIIFLTFSTILVTLVIQGLSLPWLIRLMGLKEDGVAEHEERYAREQISKAMLAEIEHLNKKSKIPEHVLEILRREGLLYAVPTESDEETMEEHEKVRELRRQLLRKGREKLIELRHRHEIGDDVMHAIQAEFDLDEVRLK
jgi:monovalent cation/hydrogen antiporter